MRLQRRLPAVRLVEFLWPDRDRAARDRAQAGGPAPQGRLGRQARAQRRDPGRRRRAATMSGRAKSARSSTGRRNCCRDISTNPKRREQAFGGGWFHSGDLATVDGEGYITVVDRKKDMIKIRWRECFEPRGRGGYLSIAADLRGRGRLACRTRAGSKPSPRLSSLKPDTPSTKPQSSGIAARSLPISRCLNASFSPIACRRIQAGSCSSASCERCMRPPRRLEAAGGPRRRSVTGCGPCGRVETGASMNRNPVAMKSAIRRSAAG